MKSFALKTVFSAAALAGVMTIAAPVVAQEAVRIGSSSVGSNLHRLGVAAGEVVNKFGKINTTVEAVGGSAATVRGIAAGKVEFGLANAFAAVTGFNGSYSFKKSGKMNIRLAVQGGQNYRALMRRKGSGINKIEDLQGRTMIGKRRPLPELELITNALIKVYGLKDVKVVGTTNTGQALKSMAVGSVDAAALPMGRRAGNIQKLLNDGHAEFLILPKDKRDEMLKMLPPLIFGETFHPEDFKGLDQDAPIFAMNTLFITSPKLSDDLVYRVVKSIFEHNKELTTYHRDGRNWTLENTLKNVQLPFHNGSIKYFKEKGVWTAKHEADQKRFLGQ